jgi:hypothetical protein
MDFNDIARLQAVGQEKEVIRDGSTCKMLLLRYDYSQQQPYTKLNQYLGSIGAAVPSTTLSTQPVFRNTGAGLLGGAMQGYNLGNNFDMGGLGAVAGGLLGGFY